MNFPPLLLSGLESDIASSLVPYSKCVDLKVSVMYSRYPEGFRADSQSLLEFHEMHQKYGNTTVVYCCSHILFFLLDLF